MIPNQTALTEGEGQENQRNQYLAFILRKSLSTGGCSMAVISKSYLKESSK